MFYTQLALALLFVVPSGSVQTTPNFAGVWEITDISPKPQDGGGVAALPPSDLTVTHTASAVSVATTSPWGDVKTTVYSLDGREDKNLSGAVTSVSRSKWVGSTLVTEGRASQVTSQGYDAWTFKEVMRLDPRGQLIIERHATFTSAPPFHSVVTHRRKKTQ
jgi:hypothetical protein